MSNSIGLYIHTPYNKLSSLEEEEKVRKATEEDEEE